MAPIRALLVSEYGALNGGEFSFLAALPVLQDAGIEFVAAVPAESGFAAELANRNVQVVPFSFHSDGARKEQSEIRDELNRLIESLSPNIVHANSLAAGRILGPVTADLKAVGLGYVRDIIKLSRKAIDDINQLDRIVAVSRATADFHIANGMSAEKVTVIHNGVDLRRFQPSRHHEPGVCLCVGQIGMRKGIDLALKMLSKAFKQVPEAELWIVGQRHSEKDEAIVYEQQLHQFADENFLPGEVKWLGRRTDIPELMQKANLLVHAAKQEPLGRVLLEASAAGLPIVTTDVGGTPEIMRDLEEFMFPPDQFDLATPTVVELLTDDERCDEVSKSLRQIAEQHFDSRIAGEKLAVCYREVCAGS